MSKKIILLAIPGIGSHSAGYSNELHEAIRRYSKNSPLENSYSFIESLPFSATDVDQNQNALFTRLNTANKLGGMLSLRKFVMDAFGDGVTFEREPNGRNSNYKKIHRYLRDKVREVNALLNQNNGAKIVIVAASMGVHVLSTYIWDADNNLGIFKNEPATDRENLRNLDYLFSLGCNIPLFISGKNESEIQPIEKRNDRFVWDNYYDEDDVLGWPLADINSAYGELVNDIEINTGQYVGSHVRYWKDKNFSKPLVQKLIELIE